MASVGSGTYSNLTLIAEEKILQIILTALQSPCFKHMGCHLQPDVTQLERAFYEQGNLGKSQSHFSKGKIFLIAAVYE